MEGQSDPEPVDEAVKRKARGAERADLCVGPRLLGLVAVVQDDQPLGEEEREKAHADEPCDALGVVHRLDRLRQHVEERHRDDDPAGERDQRHQLAVQPECDQAAGQRRDDGDGREGNGEPLHAAIMTFAPEK